MEITKQVLEAIKETLKMGFSSFYIGKTADVEDREKTHFNENGYHRIYILVEGEPCDISRYEDEVIKACKSDSELSQKLDNERSGSAGNIKADTLYAVFKYAKDELVPEDMDTEPIAEGFPINIAKQQIN